MRTPINQARRDFLTGKVITTPEGKGIIEGRLLDFPLVTFLNGRAIEYSWNTVNRLYEKEITK
jgi:hypothetical protein